MPPRSAEVDSVENVLTLEAILGAHVGKVKWLHTRMLFILIGCTGPK